MSTTLHKVHSLLVSVLGPRAGQAVYLELESAVLRAQSFGLFEEIRTWQGDFFSTFKAPPGNAEVIAQRVVTNALHYRDNYLVLAVAVLVLNVLLSPITVVTLVALASFFVYLFFVLKRTVVVIPDAFVLNAQTKPLVFGLVALLLALLTGTVTRLAWAVCYIFLLCTPHMIMRSRFLNSKEVQQYEAVKARLWSGASALVSNGTTTNNANINNANTNAYFQSTQASSQSYYYPNENNDDMDSYRTGGSGSFESKSSYAYESKTSDSSYSSEGKYGGSSSEDLEGAKECADDTSGMTRRRGK